MTTPSLVRSWLLYSEAERECAPGTIEKYATTVCQFLDLVEKSPEEVTKHDIRAWLIKMKDLGWEPSTRNNKFVVVRVFYRWAFRDKEIQTDPTEGITPPGIPDDLTLKTLTAEQLNELLSGAHGRDRALLYLLTDTGIRRNECTGIMLSDLDLESGVIRIKGKGRERRRLVVPGVHARMALEKYLRDRSKHRYAHLPNLWLGERGPLAEGGMLRILRKHGARIGIPDLHPHMLRHTWASHARRGGLSDGDLMTLGGWRSAEMLRRYGKDDAQARALEAYRGKSVADRLGRRG